MKPTVSGTTANIHIPLKEEEAIRAFMKVKPTAAMPQQGTNRPGFVVAEMNEEYGPIMPAQKPRKVTKK